MPATKSFGNMNTQKPRSASANRSATVPTPSTTPATQNNSSRRSESGSQSQSTRHGSISQSPVGNTFTASPQPRTQQREQQGSVDSISGPFYSVNLGGQPTCFSGSQFPQSSVSAYNSTSQSKRASVENGVLAGVQGSYSNSSI